VAAAKAQKIINDYHLDVSQLDFDSNQVEEDKEEVKNFGYEDPLDDQPKFGKELLQLAREVAAQNCCYVAYTKVTTYELKFRIVGRPSDVQTTRYLYGFFKNQIYEIMERCTKGNSPTYKGQFVAGVIDTICVKLNEAKKQTFAEARAAQSNNPLALVRVDKAIARLDKRAKDVLDFALAERRKVAQTYKAAGLRMGKGRGFNGARVDTGGRVHGQREGASVRMTKASGSLGSSRKSIE
jgi:hypothetical protein